MPAAPVQASTGLALATGSGTLTLSACKAGNLLAVQILSRGVADDYNAFTSDVNVEGLGGGGSFIEDYRVTGPVGSPTSSRQAVYLGRAVANGTCSLDLTVGASGEDLFARMYELEGVSRGNVLAKVVENAAATHASAGGTSTTVADAAVQANAGDRLVAQFIAIEANQAVGNLAGETGGDWTEAFAEFASAVGVAGTLQLQTAVLAGGGAIDGGTLAISSAGWGVIGLVFLPRLEERRSPALDFDFSR